MNMYVELLVVFMIRVSNELIFQSSLVLTDLVFRYFPFFFVSITSYLFLKSF